jgi:hypothetical protein
MKTDKAIVTDDLIITHQLSIQTRMEYLGRKYPGNVNNWDWQFAYERRLQRNLSIDDWEKRCLVQITLQVNREGDNLGTCRVIETLPSGDMNSICTLQLSFAQAIADVYMLIRNDQCQVLVRDWFEDPLRYKHAVLIMHGDCEPEVVSNFECEEDRDEFMINYRKKNGDQDGLYFVSYTGELEITAPRALD